MRTRSTHTEHNVLLDSSCIQALEKFQCEIGRRILKLSKFHANDTIRIGLHWPTVATRILIRKLTFLSKLLSNCNDTMSSRIFISLAIDDVYNITIIQQCKMLEASLATDQCQIMLPKLFETTKSHSSREIMSYC